VTKVEEGREYEQIEAEPQDASPSLSARMERRHEELSRQQTETFPIPGWEGLLEVELRPLGMRQSAKVVQRNQRTRDESTRSLYVTADLLLLATVGFRQVTGDESSAPINDDWVSLARRLDDCPNDPTPRQALLFLVGEERILWLYQAWEQWQRAAGENVDKELAEDFDKTGSRS
jgi:hypothetical protein